MLTAIIASAFAFAPVGSDPSLSLKMEDHLGCWMAMVRVPVAFKEEEAIFTAWWSAPFKQAPVSYFAHQPWQFRGGILRHADGRMVFASDEMKGLHPGWQRDRFEHGLITASISSWMNVQKQTHTFEIEDTSHLYASPMELFMEDGGVPQPGSYTMLARCMPVTRGVDIPPVVQMLVAPAAPLDLALDDHGDSIASAPGMATRFATMEGVPIETAIRLETGQREPVTRTWWYDSNRLPIKSNMPANWQTFCVVGNYERVGQFTDAELEEYRGQARTWYPEFLKQFDPN